MQSTTTGCLCKIWFATKRYVETASMASLEGAVKLIFARNALPAARAPTRDRKTSFRAFAPASESRVGLLRYGKRIVSPSGS